MQKKEWNNKYLLDVVAFDKNFVSLDNRRLLIAQAAGIEQIKCRVRLSDSSDKELKQFINRLTEQVEDNAKKGKITK